MTEDAELLRRYGEEKCEAAFAELVHRHLDLVYSAAIRRLRSDTHAAADITQHVFMVLARDAQKLSRHAVLTAWLYTATRNAAIDHVRAEHNRQIREQEAHTMHELTASSPSNADWASLKPVLDEAMDCLAEADRTAVLLRFFKKRPFREIGAALHLNEDAARMRVDRALEKLRLQLARRGLTSTSVALGAVLANNVIVAAPAGLAGVVTGSLGGAAICGSGAASVAGQWMAFMKTTKLGVTVAVILAASAVGTAVVEVRAQRAAETSADSANARVRSLALQIGKLRGQVANEKRSAPQERMVLVTTPAARREKPASTKPSDVDDEEMAGREFLKKHPEARALIEESAQTTFEQNWGSALRAMGVTVAEREALTRKVMNTDAWIFRITPTGWSIGPKDSENSAAGSQAREERLRELLGPERSQQLAEQLALRPVNAILEATAAATYDAGAPLSAQQRQSATHSIMNHGGRMVQRASGTLTPTVADLSNVDWPEVSRSLAGSLAPAQLAALEIAAANEAAKLEKRRAEQRFVVPAAPRKPGGGE